MNFTQIKELDQRYVLQTYSRNPVAIDHGRGATLWDTEGKEYIDFTSGIGVCSLGYGNADWARAIYDQAMKLGHISNLFYTEPYARLASKLVPAAGMAAVFFGNSGAEANEGMIKTARKYSFDKYGPGRSTIITLNNSFHGRTITTLKATGQDHFHEFFFPFTEGFRYADANDWRASRPPPGRRVRGDDGADPGGGRRESPGRGLRPGGGEALRGQGLAPPHRRGPDRRGPHRLPLRLPAVRRPARRGVLRQGHRRGAALRRLSDQ